MLISGKARAKRGTDIDHLKTSDMIVEEVTDLAGIGKNKWWLVVLWMDDVVTVLSLTPEDAEKRMGDKDQGWELIE